jgi:hypothetical protein
MADLAVPRKRPCPSCPYRLDVPSGIWAAEEYDKLPIYDRDVPEQATEGAFGLFFCHQRTGDLCAGWVGCHDMGNNLAVRLNADRIDVDAVLDYVCPVPLHASGAAAAEHGKRDLHSPSSAAVRKARGLVRLMARRTEGWED